MKKNFGKICLLGALIVFTIFISLFVRQTLIDLSPYDRYDIKGLIDNRDFNHRGDVTKISIYRVPRNDKWPISTIKLRSSETKYIKTKKGVERFFQLLDNSVIYENIEKFRSDRERDKYVVVFYDERQLVGFADFRFTQGSIGEISCSNILLYLTDISDFFNLISDVE